MSKENIIYLFVGFGTEYSLSSLAKYMKSRDFNVIEIDMCQISQSKKILCSIKGKAIVFITSWHLFFDDKNFNSYYNTQNEIFSPLEIMDYLNPVKSFYYPHDLALFLHQEEWKWLDLFDAALLPYKNNDYYFIQKHTKVYDLGWIKKVISIKRRDVDHQDIKVLYLPGHTAYNLKNSSVDDFFETYDTLLARCDGIKFPIWEGIGILMEECISKGYKLIDNNKTLFDVIEEYDVVITNGTSSVIDEAGFSGWPVIALLDGAMSDDAYLELLPSYDWLYKMNIQEAVTFLDNIKAGTERLTCGEDILKPFDIKTAVDIITNL